MAAVIKNAWEKTAGYKTVTGATLLLLFDLFTLSFPHVLNSEWKEWTTRSINLVICTGVLDKVWRNRLEIRDFLIDIFKRKEKK